MRLGPFEELAQDLAPGDQRALQEDWSGFTLERVAGQADAAFAEGFDRLWAEFGHRGEMERREVIAGRLSWDPARPGEGPALLYEMALIKRDGVLVAVRDHTAILARRLDGGFEAEVVVHLSHVLVDPVWRGSGIVAWMRALPLQAARRCRATATGSEEGPVTLVAEMEPDDATAPDVRRRLRSYARACFRVADPAALVYGQPDFRAPAEIDRTGVQPVPLWLVLRRVGREEEASMPAADLQSLVSALESMFAVHVAPRHMEVVRAGNRIVPDASGLVALCEPTALFLSPNVQDSPDPLRAPAVADQATGPKEKPSA